MGKTLAGVAVVVVIGRREWEEQAREEDLVEKKGKKILEFDQVEAGRRWRRTWKRYMVEVKREHG